MLDFGDLALTPCMAVFGEPVLYAPAAGTAFQVSGIFDAAYLEQRPTDDYAPGNISNARPALGVQLRQFPVSPQQGDQLTVASTGVVYLVFEVRQDSHGGAILLLNQAG